MLKAIHEPCFRVHALRDKAWAVWWIGEGFRSVFRLFRRIYSTIRPIRIAAEYGYVFVIKKNNNYIIYYTNWATAACRRS
jgi:hypothetical protein